MFENDIMRDSNFRYLGYADVVGKSIGPHYPQWIKPLYLLTFGYIWCDIIYKTMSKYDESHSVTLAAKTGLDAFLWQTLASVVFPSFTVGLVATAASYGFDSQPAQKMFSPRVRKLAPMIVGLVAIPFIVQPIDRFVHDLLGNTVRKWL